MLFRFRWVVDREVAKLQIATPLRHEPRDELREADFGSSPRRVDVVGILAFALPMVDGDDGLNGEPRSEGTVLEGDDAFSVGRRAFRKHTDLWKS